MGGRRRLLKDSAADIAPPRLPNTAGNLLRCGSFMIVLVEWRCWLAR